MRWRSVRNTALMLGGALMSVQALVTVLERNARPASVDPAFYAEVQQAQTAMAGGRKFDVAHRAGFAPVAPPSVPSANSAANAVRPR
jgi:hypothetical protein